MKRLFLVICILFSFIIVNAKELNITIEDIKVSEKSDTISVVDPSFDNNEVSSNITFNKLDDYVVLDITIKNNDEDKYLIKKIEDDNKNENIDIEYSFSDDYINPEETSIITMTIKYSKVLKNVESIKLDDLNISITFDDGKVIINPKTSDNLVLYVIIAIISIIGIIVALKYLKNSKKALVALVLLLPLMIIGKEVFSLKLVFKDLEVIGVFDIFNVQIKPNNNDSNETIEIRYGDSIGNLTMPDKEGYTFVGWFDDSGNAVDSNTTVTSDLIVSAKYNPIEYGITYNVDGGSTDNKNKYTIEDEVVLSDPEKAGYDFKGWYDNEGLTGDKVTKIAVGSTGDKKFYAKWEIIEYNLTYELNGGSGSNPPTYNVTDEITLNDLTKEGYDFKGWYDNSSFDGDPITKIAVGSTGNKTLYAKFDATKYTITYHTYDGTHNNPSTYTIEEEVTFSDASKNAYTFKGWYDNSSYTGSAITKIDVGTTGNKELYAKYETIEYTIIYELNSGEFSSTPVTEYTIETDTFDFLVPKRSNYAFKGWYLKGDFTGNVTYGVEKGSYGNKTVYAKWEALQDRTNQLLYNVVADGAVSDAQKSLFVEENSGIDFSEASGIRNGTGNYLLSSTASNSYPVYYYRGEVVNNNVLFANKCWLILRTTDTGGVKLVYNGVPDEGKCTATGLNTFTSSKVKYNSSYNRTESVGYTYNGSHTQTGKNLSTLVVGIVLGNDVIFDSGKYILQDTYTVDANFQDNVDAYTEKHHYTCLTTSETCDKVLYIFMGRDAAYYYITLSGGEKIEDIIENRAFNPSTTTSSTIKTNVENWYASNLTSYATYIEDTVWCNDRSTYTKGGWDKNTSIYQKVMYGPTARSSVLFQPSVACQNANDRYTVDTANGNGVLNYPIGLITADEALLAGHAWFKNTNDYLHNGHIWWTMSPSLSSANYAYVDVLYAMLDNVQTAYTSSSSTLTAGGVRPLISLRPGLLVTSGKGTKEEPYTVE